VEKNRNLQNVLWHYNQHLDSSSLCLNQQNYRMCCHPECAVVRAVRSIFCFFPDEGAPPVQYWKAFNNLGWTELKQKAFLSGCLRILRLQFEGHARQFGPMHAENTSAIQTASAVCGT
jgi:hypothetical protein